MVYYNSGLKSIFLFRLRDATQLAKYVVQADLRCLTTSYDGRKIMFGAGDGALTCLAITDPDKVEDFKQIRNMKSRRTETN